MKIKPHFVENSNGKSLKLSGEAPFNQDDDVLTCLGKISEQMVDVCWDKGDVRWYKHLVEYNASVETFSGYRVDVKLIEVKREITQEDVMDCELPEQNINEKELPFEIGIDEAFEIIKDRGWVPEPEARIIKVKSKGHVPLCERCRGTGIRACDSCGGRGTVKCSYCEGSGENRYTPRDKVSTEKYWRDGVLYETHNYVNHHTQCPECQGTGVQTCGSCGGQKFFPCESCNGTGKKDGATSAATVTSLKEIFEIESSGDIVLENGETVSLLCPEDKICADRDAGEFFFSNKTDKISLECEVECEAYLSKYIKDMLDDVVKKGNGCYLVGLSIQIEELPKIKKITVFYDNNEFEFFIIGNKFKGPLSNPSISLWEEIFKTYRKKI